jgi:hypothetical protein
MAVNAGAIRAGRAFVELSLRDRTSKGLAAAAARLRAFSTGIQQLGRNLIVVGGVMAAPFILSLKELAAKDKAFAATLKELKTALSQVGVSIGKALQGPITKLVKLFVNATATIVRFIDNNPTLVRVLAASAVGLVALGVALIFVGKVAMIASIGMTVFSAVAGFLLSPLGLVLLYITGLVAAFIAFNVWLVRNTDAGRAMAANISSVLIPALLSLADTIKVAFDLAAIGEWEKAMNLALMHVSLLAGKVFGHIANRFDSIIKSAMEAANIAATALGVDLKLREGINEIDARIKARVAEQAALEAMFEDVRNASRVPAAPAVGGLGTGGSFGTFNPEAARRFFGGSDPAERTADATEEAVTILDEIRREFKTKKVAVVVVP